METIIGYPNEILEKKSGKIVQFDAEIAAIGEKLKKLIKAKNGVGLAAVQVGSPVRLVAVRDPGNPETGGEPLLLANPRVLRSEGEKCASEGCLSIPGVWLDITRPLEVEIESDLPGGGTRRDVFREYLARGIMHEIDHMDGMLIWDHLPPRERDEAINRFLDLKRRR